MRSACSHGKIRVNGRTLTGLLLSCTEDILDNIMSGKKDNTPPGKPPTSRLSLGKIRGKPGSSGSISIRFNAASLDEDDYDLNDDLSIGLSGSGRPRGDSVKFEIKKDDRKVYSQSAPTSEASTPVSAMSSSTKPATNSKLITDSTLACSEVSDDTTPATGEKSILSGLKEKLHEKLPEPINAFIEKIEVLTDSSPEDIKKKFHKSESQDSESSVKMSQSDSADRISVRKSESIKSESMESTRSIPGVTASLKGSSSDIASGNRSRQGSTESEISESNCETHGDSVVKTDSCFEVVEDYYDNTFDEPSIKAKHSISSAGRSSSTEPFVTKQRSSSLRKLIGQKDRGASPARGIKTAMTLSGLLSSKSDDSIHSHTTSSVDLNVAKEKPESEQFYDIDNQDNINEESCLKSQSDDAKEKSVPSKTPLEDQVLSAPKHKYIAVAISAVLYLIIPLPSFMSGLVLGATVMYCALQAYQWLSAPPKPKEPFILPDLNVLPPLVVPEMKESRNTDGKFQAWMNELQGYNPDDYHINLTASVYVTLEGTTLRLQRPKINVSKRAMWDEPAHNPTFVHQRHFDLKDSRVFLEPAGLVRKRLWSKKYPICIALSKNSNKRSSEVKFLGVNDKGHSQAEGGSFDKDKKLVTQASLDEEKIRHSEKKERKLTVQMSLDEGKLEQMSTETSELELGNFDGEEMDTDDKLSEAKDISMDGYEVISKEECDTKILYLFGRTGREKEEWYRRFVAASQGQPWPTRMSDLRPKLSESTTGQARSTSPGPESQTVPLRKRHSSSSLESLPSKHHKRQGSADSTTFSLSETSLVNDSIKTTTTPTLSDIDQNNHEKVLVEYLRYMSLVLPKKTGQTSRATSPVGKQDTVEATKSSRERCEPYCVWVNTFISRCFWDFLRETYWANYMKQKIQRKLSKIHVPFFIDELTVTDIMLGSEMPVIRRISRPYMDDRGLWMDMDVAYNGGFQMSLETKVNLMKLKKEKLTMRSQSRRLNDRRSAVLNEDEEDSAESSTDEEAEVTTYVANEVETTGGSTGKKLLRLVDKLTQNKYFQQATENKFVKRAMEGVSNTPLMLNVELRSLMGTLAVNIPPPPTDRIWYGFRTNPKLWLSAKPKVGERQVTVTHVTEWIEKKLSIEFQRVFVMPNMDDIPIPLMCDHLPDNPPTFETAL